MPYGNERASRLGHVEISSQRAIRNRIGDWTVLPRRAFTEIDIEAATRMVDDLPGSTDPIDTVVVVDGSDQEVGIDPEFDIATVNYLQVGTAVIDLPRFEALSAQRFIDPAEFRSVYTSSALYGVVPGAYLAKPGMTGLDTWREAVHQFIEESSVADPFGSSTTLSEAMMMLAGRPDDPATEVEFQKCPLADVTGCKRTDLVVPLGGTKCPGCGSWLYPSDTLATHAEYRELSSSFGATSRLMNMSERLVMATHQVHAMLAGADLSRMLFVTDGPLAVFGYGSRLGYQLNRFNTWFQRQHGDGLPLSVGVEKNGSFVNHGRAIAEQIPVGGVVLVDDAHADFIQNRPAGSSGQRTDFYGRRFFFRAAENLLLTLTIVPKAGVLPYGSEESQEWDSYPSLGPVCRALSGMGTSLYQDAIIPLAIAHNTAALPIGIGKGVLSDLARHQLQGIANPDLVSYRPSTPSF